MELNQQFTVELISEDTKAGFEVDELLLVACANGGLECTSFEIISPRDRSMGSGKSLPMTGAEQ
jgi:hypothetical protein